MTMPAEPRRYTTAKFSEPAPIVAFGAVVAIVAALVISPFFSRTVLQERINLAPNATATLPPIEPRANRIGALRVDVRARVPRNTWVTFEVQIRDREGNPLAAALKQAWRRSSAGSDENTRGLLDLRREDLNQPVQIAIASLEQGSTGLNLSNSPALSTSIPFDITVRDGVVDTRFLWSGFWVGLVLSGFAALTAVNSGQMALHKTIGESDVDGRARLGGSDKLVRAIVTVESDETTPPVLHAELAIKDGQGNLVYEAKIPLRLTMHRDDDGSLDRATGKCQIDLVLSREDSYGFSVEIVPDAPVDRTTLKVLQNVRTLRSVEVTEVASLA
ncbi:MAG: hypothetical protein AAFX40_10910 [Cyanobacteria bacterium J06639_1]